MRKKAMKKILPVLVVATCFTSTAYAASAGAALRADNCFAWRLSESLLNLCLGEMRNAATDAEREAVAQRFHPDNRLPAGAPNDYGRPPRNAAQAQQGK